MNSRIALRSTVFGLAGLVGSACTITAGNNSPDGGAASAPTDASADQGTGPGEAASSSPSTDASFDAGTVPDDATTPTEASGGDAGNEAATTNNGCADPPADDHTPATSTMITLGTALHACLRSGTDVNYYQYTVPTSPPKGGYVIVKVSDVGLQGTVDMSTLPTSDGAELIRAYDTTPGGGVVHFFAAKPGASFRAAVKNFLGPPAAAAETPYTITVTFTGVNDPSAPNGTVATAASLLPSTPVQGYFFAGLDSTATPPITAWESWYKVTLPAGMAAIALTNVPADAAGDVEFFDSTTTSIDRHYNITDGANVQFTAAAATAGDYYVRVLPWSHSPESGSTPNIPAWMTQPWTLTVAPQ